jgi:serine/threonine protein kinase
MSMQEQQEARRRQRLGRYELLERLGEGGMGEVWKAHDTQLRRAVAIKLLRSDLSGDPDFGASFLREARLVAALRHPNIVQIHDFQLADSNAQSRAYMVMDYIEGGTLAASLRATVRQGLFWSASDIVELFTSISLALDYAHNQGMIHRDIKPANILLQRPPVGSRSPGEPVLTDFGIARWQGGGSTVTGFVGTPLYISPEQAQNDPVDERSDLYSLGIVLYEILTGVVPFRGGNPLAIMLQHVHEPPPPPVSLNPRVSPALSAVVLRSIAKNPQERFPGAAQMTIALAQAFNLAMPARLERAGTRSASQTFNPLQPGAAPALTATAVVPGQSMPQARAADDVLHPPSLPEHAFARPQRGKTRWLPLVSALCFILLLLGSGAAIALPRLFAPASTSAGVSGSNASGRILFRHSSTAPQGVFDQLEVDLSGVPSPPAGQRYYAWLTQANSEAAAIPHWQLQVYSGSVQALYTGSSPHDDLLAGSDGFLITTEDASSAPVIPIPAPERHLYYALIPHPLPASPIFAVRSCPVGKTGNPPAPCL